ncbi:hypothetical protein F4680DRAFT_470304 [Xylaria scruposa]|nr:hypothetical protein F4680DRAFT_470304 [Xylaria scruposa]
MDGVLDCGVETWADLGRLRVPSNLATTGQRLLMKTDKASLPVLRHLHKNHTLSDQPREPFPPSETGIPERNQSARRGGEHWREPSKLPMRYQVTTETRKLPMGCGPRGEALKIDPVPMPESRDDISLEDMGMMDPSLVEDVVQSEKEPGQGDGNNTAGRAQASSAFVDMKAELQVHEDSEADIADVLITWYGIRHPLKAFHKDPFNTQHSVKQPCKPNQDVTNTIDEPRPKRVRIDEANNTL